MGADQTRFTDGAGNAPKAGPGELPTESSLLPVPVESTGRNDSSKPPTPVGLAEQPQGNPTSLTSAEAPAGTQPGPRAVAPSDGRTEVIEERGAHTQVFANPDGTRTLQVSDEPVNFRTGDGRWETIDTSLTQTAPPLGAKAAQPSAGGATPPQTWETKASGHRVQIADQANSPTLATLSTGPGQSVGFSVDGAAPTSGTAAGDTMTFTGVRSEADLQLSADASALKETIILHSRQAPDIWTFPLRTEGLTPALDTAGNIELKDQAGQVRATVPAGWMMDSATDPGSGDGATSGGVRYTLDPRPGGGWTLTVALDRAWLDDPARVYPVMVDPTVVVTPDTNSVSIVQGRNYTQTDVFRLGYNCDGGVCNNAAILLNTSEVSSKLARNTINGARLNLWNTHTYDCQAPRTVTVHANTGSWNPSTVRYPGPGYGEVLGSAKFGYGNEADGCGDAWAGIDFNSAGAAALQRWANGQANYGLTVRTALNDANTWKKFATVANRGVKLEVSYTPHAATYQSGGILRPVTSTQEGAAKITVNNTGSSTWTPSGNSLRYHLYTSSWQELGNTVATALPSQVNPGGSVTLEARIAPVTPGDYYICWDMHSNAEGFFSALGVQVLCQSLASANGSDARSGDI
ncbi:DNRLRE domain-containing protein [Yinghuangia aomiensis]|uniref:DNRLRE domain-containing protein n=1 Tax=Yinghuangia aomiensis TaxID=676205 RepID=UPI0031EF0C17